MLAVGTVVFPDNLKYFQSFLRSLERQDIQGFCLLIINDGCEDLQAALNGYDNEVQIKKFSSDPFSNRLALIEFAIENSFRKLIFADSDDWLESNRVGVMNALLEKYEVVASDLTLVNETGNKLQNNYWSSRLESGEIDSDFLADKNIFGFGNSAIRLCFSRNDIKKEQLIAPDWFFFTQMANNANLFFTTATTSYYRQHTQNITGLKKLTPARLERILEVKNQHYSALQRIGYNTDNYLAEMDLLKRKYQDKEALIQDAERLNNLSKPFFWWEETNYL